MEVWFHTRSILLPEQHNPHELLRMPFQSVEPMFHSDLGNVQKTEIETLSGRFFDTPSRHLLDRSALANGAEQRENPNLDF